MAAIWFVLQLAANSVQLVWSRHRKSGSRKEGGSWSGGRRRRIRRRSQRWGEVWKERQEFKKTKIVEVRLDGERKRKRMRRSMESPLVPRNFSSAWSLLLLPLSLFLLLLLLLPYKESFLQFVIDETSLNSIFMEEKYEQMTHSSRELSFGRNKENVRARKKKRTKLSWV